MLQDRTVVVAGVGPGLGREVARLALREGARVVVGARNEERLAKLAAELDPSGRRLVAQPFDLTDPGSRHTLLARAEERFGGIDALVVVAALDALFGDLESTRDDDWRRVFEVNVIGTLGLCRAAVPVFKRGGGGSIVLIGSQAYAHPPDTPQLAYAASKGALLSAMFQIAKELGPHRIRINTVVPTWMWGPAVESYVTWQARERGVSEDEIRAAIERKFLLPGIPADEDVAEAVIFFCSDRSRMITGQYLRVDAGEKLG